MKVIPPIGSIVYTCAPDSESEGYGDTEPREPTRVKIKEVLDPLGLRPMVVVCGFNEETGVLDHDSNATCYVEADRLYATEVEALEAYVQALGRLARELEERHQEVLNRGEGAHRRWFALRG